MDFKSIDPTLQQSKTKNLAMSCSTLQRYKHDINMLSPNRNSLNSN